MFDFHIHSSVSFDGKATPEALVRAAEKAGLREICFTDHIDEDPRGIITDRVYNVKDYNAGYDHLCSDKLKIRLGFEFGLLDDNRASFRNHLSQRHYDFVLGSIHFAANEDIYYGPYWDSRNLFQGERQYFEDMLRCVELHNDFDVLAHMTYISKAKSNPYHTPVKLEEHRDVIAAVMETLIKKGKGMEINTSGVDSCGAFLPTEDFLRLFKDLGGQIVAVGSDTHTTERVGQYTDRVCAMLKDIFGYVCTFEDRIPIFHKL
jgi:histidinol-phosphatase (PHP family)